MNYLQLAPNQTLGDTDGDLGSPAGSVPPLAVPWPSGSKPNRARGPTTHFRESFCIIAKHKTSRAQSPLQPRYEAFRSLKGSSEIHTGDKKSSAFLSPSYVEILRFLVEPVPSRVPSSGATCSPSGCWGGGDGVGSPLQPHPARSPRAEAPAREAATER